MLLSSPKIKLPALRVRNVVRTTASLSVPTSNFEDPFVFPTCHPSCLGVTSNPFFPVRVPHFEPPLDATFSRPHSAVHIPVPMPPPGPLPALQPDQHQHPPQQHHPQQQSHQQQQQSHQQPLHFQQQPPSFAAAAGLAPLLPSQSFGVPIGARTVSQTRSVGPEWRLFSGIEERTAVRLKLRGAYHEHAAGDYERLLSLVAAIDEELIFASAGSRLEYMHEALDWNKRVGLKLRHLEGGSPNECVSA